MKYAELCAGYGNHQPSVTRNEQLKAARNGVVPQQAAAALIDMRRLLDD